MYFPIIWLEIVPISNTEFLSKLTERVVLMQINAHIARNRLQCPEQHGYKPNHSTETLLRGLADEILLGFEQQKCTIVLFVDLSAAFDTVDLDILLGILQNELGIVGIALNWIKSFLTGRKQMVRIDDEYSDNNSDASCGVPQGSILGPTLYNIYTRSQSSVFQKCGFKSSGYADDSNGRKTFSLMFQYEILKNSIEKCLIELYKWMNMHKLKINPGKTEIELFHPKTLSDDIMIKGTHIMGQCIRFSNVVKNVGFLLDHNFTLDNQVNKTVSYGFKLLRDVGSIRPVLSEKHTEMLMHAIISSRLDYCNSVYVNMSKSNVYKLQKLQNAAARLITKTKRRESAEPLLHALHWLNVNSRIAFKILLLTFKSTRLTCSENLSLNYRDHNYRPHDYLSLETWSPKTQHGKRTFKFAAPRLWNCLPVNIRCAESVDDFKRLVKTLLFSDNGFVSRALLM